LSCASASNGITRASALDWWKRCLETSSRCNEYIHAGLVVLRHDIHETPDYPRSRLRLNDRLNEGEEMDGISRKLTPGLEKVRERRRNREQKSGCGGGRGDHVFGPRRYQFRASMGRADNINHSDFLKCPCNLKFPTSYRLKQSNNDNDTAQASVPCRT
jgi:hypothetical protein